MKRFVTIFVQFSMQILCTRSKMFIHRSMFAYGAPSLKLLGVHFQFWLRRSKLSHSIQDLSMTYNENNSISTPNVIDFLVIFLVCVCVHEAAFVKNWYILVDMPRQPSSNGEINRSMFSRQTPDEWVLRSNKVSRSAPFLSIYTRTHRTCNERKTTQKSWANSHYIVFGCRTHPQYIKRMLSPVSIVYTNKVRQHALSVSITAFFHSPTNFPFIRPISFALIRIILV